MYHIFDDQQRNSEMIIEKIKNVNLLAKLDAEMFTKINKAKYIVQY